MILTALKHLPKSYLLHSNICRRCVTTWSPLAISFNSRPINQKLNFNYLAKNEGLFGIGLYIKDDLYHFARSANQKVELLLYECCNEHRNRKLVQVFDDLSDTICRVADLSEFIRIMHRDPEFSRASREVCIAMSNLVEKLNTNKELYDCIKKVAENGDKFLMTEEEKRVIDLFVFDFEQCGIHLPESDRELVLRYNDSILQSGQEFMEYSALARTVDKNSIPPSLLSYYNISSNGEVIITGYSDITDEYIREAAYKIYLSPGVEPEKLLDEVLCCRHKLARICGFPTYAHRALRGSTAETPEFVLQFLNTLNDKLRDKVEEDFNVMRKAKASESTQALAMWDVPYYTAKMRRQWLKLDPKEYQPYFSLGACMDGLNNLFNNLFSISMVEERLSNSEIWAPSVYKLAVNHETEGLLGYIYCDFFEQLEKPNQDCHYTIQGGRHLPDGSYQNPIVVVVLNLPNPNDNVPCLLSPNMVENLFHEMGHAIHSMLGRAQYQHITGTRCVTDFAEVPSILMEYFAKDPRVLKSFARHYKTGKPIPDEMLERLCGLPNVFNASELQSQIFYSVLDQVYHTNESVPGRTTEILAEVQSNYYPVPYVPNTAWHLKFSHLIGYGAKYYSYLMSRAIASSIWDICFKENPFNDVMGEKYRRECLAHGGGKAPRILVKDFLNLDITPDILIKSLIKEIDANENKI